jgi:hypothetical protein
LSSDLAVKPRAFKYLAKATPPPLTGIAVAIDYANIGLDPDVSLYERFNAVSTAVRLLATIRREQFVASVAKLLEDSGLCEVFKELNVDVCVKGRGGGDEAVVKRLVELVNACERGDIPVTEELVLALAQAVIVVLVPQLRIMQQQVLPPEEVG